jgi:crotonobetainyl-CoA:carnitine CoA-transferase CaiB-like acyl-CoA transferase
MNSQPLPLTGIRVVDYTHFLAGPFLSRCLAAMGAEVIKVERPKAGDAGRAHAMQIDGQSGYFLQQNMGKQGLCIDL